MFRPCQSALIPKYWERSLSIPVYVMDGDIPQLIEEVTEVISFAGFLLKLKFHWPSGIPPAI